MPAPGDQYGNVKNPFEEPCVGQFSAQEIATLQSRLNKQLGPEYISQRPGNGGGRVAYLEGNKAIALANEVFGFNGWSSSLGQVQIDYVDESPSGKVSLGLSIVVRITLKCGTYHEDIGYGSIENGKGKAASFEKAKKEAATDGLKRALRTFGNVLGNCLYDKEYLKRVQNMKVKPIRFNEENLHRHADFMPPPKKEEMASATSGSHRTPVKSNGILRTRTEHLNGSVAGEFDDEDDGALFDGVELTEHSEDLKNDQPAIHTIESNKPALAPNGVTSNRTSPVRNTGPPRRSPNQGMQTASAPRVPNGVQQTHTLQNGQNNAPGRPPAQMQNGREPQTPVQQQAHRQRPGALTATDIHALPMQQNGHPPPQNQPFGPTPPQAQQPSEPNGITTPGPNSRPVGFVTSRVAEQMQKSDAASLTNLAAFNPHADSPVPKAKRTPGVDYTRSVPIKRGELGAPPAPPSLAPLSNNGNASGFNKPGTAPGGRIPRGNNTNFVNPQQDMHRRIGAPGGMGGMARTSAYKVPSKRPPLEDVSNHNQRNDAGEPEAKKQRVEGVAPSVGIENGGTEKVQA